MAGKRIRKPSTVLQRGRMGVLPVSPILVLEAKGTMPLFPEHNTRNGIGWNGMNGFQNAWR